ncbi:MAG: amino acid racemase [Hyphomicrobiales bacterium]|jgi:aspartate racemase
MLERSALRPVGVLGGMGPEATLLFMQRVLAAVPARDDADHIPLLVDQNPQVPSRIGALIEGTGEDPSPALSTMARRLEVAGAQALVMPCNTAHAYAPAIRAAVTIPFLSMVDVTAQTIAAHYPGAKVGMLASPAVKLTGVFEPAFKAAGLSPLYADDQGGLLQAIRCLKQDGADVGARKTAVLAANALRASGADIVLVGCSEFSMLTQDIAAEMPLIDSLDVLVSATVTFSQLGDSAAGVCPTAVHRPGAASSKNHSGQTTREAVV